jgi:hypothetical protein
VDRGNYNSSFSKERIKNRINKETSSGIVPAAFI